MSTLEIKEKLQSIINSGNEESLRYLYQANLEYLDIHNKMILEAEEDIKNGNFVLHQDVKKQIENWKSEL